MNCPYCKVQMERISWFFRCPICSRTKDIDYYPTRWPSDPDGYDRYSDEEKFRKNETSPWE